MRAALIPILFGKPELIRNGRFDSDTDWTKTAAWTIANGVATKAVGAGTLDQARPLIAGRTYTVKWTVTGFGGTGVVFIRFSGGSSVSGTSRSTNGTFTDTMTAAVGNNLFEVVPTTNDTVFDVDNISLKRA